MTLVQLQHLIALAQSGSFSQAASAVFLTQSALSRSIRALEDELGQALFDRIGRRSELTPFGREVLKRAQRLVDDADDIQASSRLMKEGQAGVVRLGLGSGPGAMLMTPLLRHMATQHPGVHVDISRGSTELLVQALRAKTLDALVLDARSLKPASDLSIEVQHEMRGAFLCRRGHPLTRKRRPLSFDALMQYPLASTPLSDEVARILMERYGPQAHPSLWVTLRCDEIPSLVDVVRDSDAILLAIRAAAPDLLELTVQPELAAMARFGLVTLAGRTGAPALEIVRSLMQELLHD